MKKTTVGRMAGLLGIVLLIAGVVLDPEEGVRAVSLALVVAGGLLMFGGMISYQYFNRKANQAKNK